MIKNDNGNEYEILDQWEVFAVRESRSWKQVVVAYNYSPDFKTWQHGEYFNDRKEAQRYFDSKKEN